MTTARHTSLATAAAIIAAALTACTPAAAPAPTPAQLPTAWVLKTPTHAIITQWTEHSGAITGTVDEAFQAPTGPAKLTTEHNGITGTISNGKITFTTDTGGTITGTIDADTLHLSIPDHTGLSQIDLHPGSTDDYTKATDDVKTGITQTIEKAAAAQASKDAATAIQQYQDRLAGVDTSAAAVGSARGAAVTAMGAVRAAKGAFMDYTGKVLAGACWNDDQMSRAETLFSAVSTAYGPAAEQLDALKKADQDLDGSLTDAGTANAAAVASNGRLGASAQMSIPDGGSVLTKGRDALAQANTVQASMHSENEAAVDDASKVIDSFSTDKYCS